MTLPFQDRRDAGQQLAGMLRQQTLDDNPIVLALPRGGVPVGAEIAQALRVPLDVLVVRKLGLPAQPELAMGAIASGGAEYLNQPLVDAVGVSAESIELVRQREAVELRRRETTYRGDRPPPLLRGRTVIVVDDGIATGATMHAALLALRGAMPQRIVVAVPVAAADALSSLQDLADIVVCLHAPSRFDAVGQFYRHFDQTTDAEVRALLATKAPNR